jgi:HSP20 family molecular chaperone IbpA
MAQGTYGDDGQVGRNNHAFTFREPRREAAFKPPLDVIADDECVILEMLVPGVEREDISIERTAEGIVVRGVRRGTRDDAARYFHEETPRGAFERVIPIPFRLEGELPVELDRGVLRIRLVKPPQDGGSDVNQVQHNAGENGDDEHGHG